jgi:hypothetical protein
MAELMFGLGQTKKKKETEAKVRTTKANLKDVTITEVCSMYFEFLRTDERMSP